MENGYCVEFEFYNHFIRNIILSEDGFLIQSKYKSKSYDIIVIA